MPFHFRLLSPGGAAQPVGSPVEDGPEAIARAQRLALDFAAKRPELLAPGHAIEVVDGDGREFHCERIDSAAKHA